MVDSNFQVNSNIAFTQGGSLGAPQSNIVVGGLSGKPSLTRWQDLQYVFASNNPSKISLFEDFLRAGQTLTAQYTITSNGTAAATTVLGTVAGGVASLAAGTDDNGFTQLATGRSWTVGNGTTWFTARFKKNTATAHSIEVGLSTVANIATDGNLFSNHTAAGATASANISTARCIVVGADSDSSATVLSVAAYDATTASAVDSTALFDTEYHTVEFIITADATSYIYVDNVLVTTLTDIFLTSSVVTPYFSSKALSANAATLYVDYFGLVGDRS